MRKFSYFLYKKDTGKKKKSEEMQGEQNISNDKMLDKLLEAVGREALREQTPSLHELEQTLQDVIMDYHQKQSKNNEQQEWRQYRMDHPNVEVTQTPGLPIISQLIEKGYLKDSPKWLTKKGFMNVGDKILNNVMKTLKTDTLGLHESSWVGYGTTTLDTTKKYEPGDDQRLINVPLSLLNTVQRISKDKGRFDLPLHISIDDWEQSETKEDVRVAIVYCIDLSSTMRYSTMFGDLSRIEAAKRALWSLVLLNQKFFSSDSIYIVGFGALASKIPPQDVPYLKTFEPGSDFLHYTNYQAAFRLASKLLLKDHARNRRIVLVTDGHPSACFIDTKIEQDNILALKPYSTFYLPDKNTLNSINKNYDMTIDMSLGDLVYLCYRHRQVDQYIGNRTIMEAKKCHRLGIEIDTIMISEDDLLLGYINEMEKCVKGRSYYINPSMIDKVLLTDYLTNKKSIIRS